MPSNTPKPAETPQPPPPRPSPFSEKPKTPPFEVTKMEESKKNKNLPIDPLEK